MLLYEYAIRANPHPYGTNPPTPAVRDDYGHEFLDGDRGLGKPLYHRGRHLF